MAGGRPAGGDAAKPLTWHRAAARFGWVTLNLDVVPLLIVALVAAVGIERRLRPGARLIGADAK